MKLEEFASHFHQEVLARCGGGDDGERGSLREDAFTELMLDYLTEANQTDAGEVCYYRSKGRRNVPATKLNAFSFSGDGATLDLFVCIYRGKGNSEPVPRSEVIEFFTLLRGFLERSLAGFHVDLEESHEVFEAAQRIYEQRETLSTARLFLLTDGITKAAEVKHEPLQGLETRHFLWDIAKLHQFQESGREREAIELQFEKELGGAIPCLGQADATREYWTFLAFLPGSVLARIYAEHGPRLLEKNVRSFLQVRGRVNKGIQETIAEVPHRFLAYNNGLAATAAEIEMDDRGEGHYRLIAARDFQIVNGGQTTASIYHALKKEKADISHVIVQVKLTVATDQVKLTELVPLISLYANSQNKVNTADFSANEPFHQKLEELSRTIWAPAAGGLDRGTRWYYERARGSYLDDKARQGTPARMREWERQHPLTQKFTKTDLAKFENTWDEQPYLVSRGAEKNFTEWTLARRDEGWPVADDAFFRQLVAKALLFRRSEQIVSAQELPGYRAQIVTYTIAWLSRSSGQRIDLEGIWNFQVLPTKLSQAIDAVAQAARKHIINPPGGRNITEWCKNEECWMEFREQPVRLPRAWEGEWAEKAFVTAVSDGDSLAARWEKVRLRFVGDARSVGEMALQHGLKWPASRWAHTISEYTVLPWEKLRMKRAFGPGKQRGLIEILEAVHGNG